MRLEETNSCPVGKPGRAPLRQGFGGQVGEQADVLVGSSVLAAAEAETATQF